MDAEMKPCPICNRAPRRNGRGRVGGVVCEGPGEGVGELHRVQTYGADQAEADAAWNRRALDAARAESAGWRDTRFARPCQQGRKCFVTCPECVGLPFSSTAENPDERQQPCEWASGNLHQASPEWLAMMLRRWVNDLMVAYQALGEDWCPPEGVTDPEDIASYLPQAAAYIEQGSAIADERQAAIVAALLERGKWFAKNDDGLSGFDRYSSAYEDAADWIESGEWRK